MYNPIYPILNRDAKNWWYHKQLRESGDPESIAKARKLERDSIKEHVKILRRACFAFVNRSGWSVTTSLEKAERSTSKTTLQGYGGINAPVIQCCLLLGVPVIDTTTIPEEKLSKAFRVPIAAVEGEEYNPPPWGAFDRAPLAYVASRYMALGATVYGLTWESMEAEEAEQKRAESKYLTPSEVVSKVDSEMGRVDHPNDSAW